MILRTRIKELRARYNLTQDELAEMVGVSRQTMLYLEKGKYNPSLLLAYKVAKALKSSINEVFIIENNTWGFIIQCLCDLPTDWCLGGPNLACGLCSSTGCSKCGGTYKLCCDSATNNLCSKSCVRLDGGANYNGVCASGCYPLIAGSWYWFYKVS